MRVFGIDPGSARTGYGCLDSDGTRHRLVECGALTLPAAAPLPVRLDAIHQGLTALLHRTRPDVVVVESVFHAANARSALVLGHARGVALLAAVQARVPVVEYTPAEVKRAVVGYGRADKGQVQRMVALLLGLETAPSPHDVSDALAIAVCHLHRTGPLASVNPRHRPARSAPRSWRQWKP